MQTTSPTFERRSGGTPEALGARLANVVAKKGAGESGVQIVCVKLASAMKDIQLVIFIYGGSAYQAIGSLFTLFFLL